jgi:hypothetical protein
MQRRLARLQPIIARRFPLPPPPVDESLLSPEEWDEVVRISAITKEGGLAALSDAELDQMECFARKLAGGGGRDMSRVSRRVARLETVDLAGSGRTSDWLTELAQSHSISSVCHLACSPC